MQIKNTHVYHVGIDIVDTYLHCIHIMKYIRNKHDEMKHVHCIHVSAYIGIYTFTYNYKVHTYVFRYISHYESNTSYVY